jgi:RNA polymerase sigma factor (sigma-70 family)
VPDELPREVAELLCAESLAARDAAWERFVAVHTRLLLHVTRTLVHDPDVAMDAYAELLERLREDDSRRLRGFAAAGRSKFTTWLVVVSRRICVDWLRHRGGRTRTGAASGTPALPSQLFRRRLLGMAGEAIPLDSLRDARHGADDDLERAEIHEALTAALDGLSSADRLLLALRFDDGLKASEIARVMKLPSPFHVYRRLDHVLRTLRRSLSGSGVDSPA